MNRRRAVFLDRDGTIVRSYGRRPANTVEEIALLPRVAEGMRELAESGLFTVVVTNQGGIALGYMDEAMLLKMNVRLDELLKLAGAPGIGAYYHCVHMPDAGCGCRKPRPGMLISAADDFNIDLSHSYMVGDMVSDMEAAVCAGVKWPLQVISDMSQDSPLARMRFATFKDAAHAVALLESMKL